MERCPWLVGFVGLVAACGMAGCADSAPERVSEDVAPIVRDGVTVIDAEPGKDIDVEASSFAASRARYPELAARVPGDIVVSGKGGGLLRRVRGVRGDGDRVVLDTEPASLEEVFQQAHVRASLGDAQVEGPAPQGGIAPRYVALRLPTLSVDGRVLEIGDGSRIEIVHSEFSLEPKLDLDLLVRGGRLETLKLVATGESHAQARVKYVLKKPLEAVSGVFVRFDKAGVRVAEAPPVYAVVWVGYVPIVVTVRARLLASWNIRIGGDMVGTQEIKADGSTSLGVDYHDGEWHPVASRTLTLDTHGEGGLTSDALMGEVNLTARLDIAFYDVAGPYLGMQAYGGIAREAGGANPASGWFVVGGVRGIAGAQVGIFGRSLSGYESVLFDLHGQTQL